MIRVLGSILAAGLLLLQPGQAFSQAGAPPAVAPALASIQERFAASLQPFQVPGAALLIIKGDTVVLSAPAGRTRVAGGRAVTDETVFPIGSNTKAFTAALIGMLVDEGKLRWDDPVRLHLPDVRFHDPYVSEHATIRDLLAMRTGVASELMWLGSGMSPADIIRRLPAVSPSAGFRERYVYSNLNYLVAGKVIEKVTGSSWDDAIRRRIFQPLRMTRSYTRASGLVEGRNSADSHVLLNGRAVTVPHPDLDALAAAGTIHASLADMGKWVRFQFTGRSPGGEQLLTPATLKELHTPQMLMAGSKAYALGWEVSPTYRRKPVKLVNHVGSTLAALSIVAFVPEEKIGVIVLVNRSDLDFANAALLQALDSQIGTEPKDNFAEALQGRAALTAARREIRSTALGSAAVRPYLGRYEHPALGPLTIALEQGRPVLRRGAWVGDLTRLEHGRLRVEWQDPYFAALGGNTLAATASPETPVMEIALWGARFTRTREGGRQP